MYFHIREEFQLAPPYDIGRGLYLLVHALNQANWTAELCTTAIKVFS